MALVLKDRVQETATANTTVSFSLAGAVTGFQTFSSAISNADTTYYSATDASGNWEVGLGTYATTGNLLTRTTILASSNTGSAVTFSGTVNVFITYPAGKSFYLDASGNAIGLGTVAATSTLTNATGLPISTGVSGLGTGIATALGVNTGTAGSVVVNGGVLGTPSSGTVTNLTGTASININGTVGATTANTGVFTTISSATVPTNTVPTLALTGTPNAATGGKTGVLGVGANFTASDKNIMASFVQSINDYTQIIVQNPNAGASASADLVVNNDNTTGSGVYGDFGINSSAFTGTGSLTLANATYLYSNGGDFVFGTNTANIVRFVINNSATDIGTITSTGLNGMAIGATTASTGAFTTLSATGAITANTTTNNQSFTTTGAGTITITSGTAGNINNMTIGATTPAAITGTTITDSIGNVRTIVQNAQSGATSYTLVSTDAGKHIYVTGTGGVTMPVSVFTAGQAITIVNNTAASITITAPSAGTMYLSGTATTGNRTLAQRGMATALYVVAGATPTIIISGSGLT